MTTNASPPSDTVDDVAYAWYARLLSGNLLRSELAALENWLASDPSHEAAFQRARSVYASVVGDPLAVPRKEQKRVMQARKRNIAGAVCAAGVILATLPSLPWLLADGASRVGQVKRVDLADGTTAYLDSASAFDIDYDDNVRTIRLEEGRAWFDVAHERRPFRVVAGRSVVTDVGTEFSVSLPRSGSVDVAVEQGIVDVTTDGHTRRMVAGLKGSFGPDGAPSISAVEPGVFGWREGRLSFTNRPLGEVIAEIGRYRRGIVYLADRDLAKRRVSAMLSLDSLDSGIAALAESQGLEVRSYSPWITVLSRKQ